MTIELPDRVGYGNMGDDAEAPTGEIGPHEHDAVPFCDIGSFGPAATRLYFASPASAPIGFDAWDAFPGLEGEGTLSFTPTNTSHGGSDSNDTVNAPVGHYGSSQYDMVIGSGPLLDRIRTGGELKYQMVAVSRSGVGINEASQMNYHSLSIRIMRSGVLVGQPIALGEAVGTERFIPGNATNRSIVATYRPVPGALSTDRLYVEYGWYHVGPTGGGTGAAFNVRDDEAADLPEGNTADELFNSWIQFGAYVFLEGGAHPDLAGDPEEDHASRCDHAHHLLRDYAPSATDDSSDGIPATTMWTNTITGQTWLLVDDTPGAAIWMTAGTNNHGTLAGLTDDDHLQYMRGAIQLADPAATARDGDFWVENA